ncbi:hypothetical protein N9R79_06615 [Vibrio sp.]|nr:hypothetical protein [Vibrio sp.]
MNSIFNMISEYRVFAIAGLSMSSILGAIYYFVFTERGRLDWKTMCFTMPLIGKNVRLAKNMSVDDKGWFHSDNVVAESYWSDYFGHKTNKDYFHDAVSYLEKMDENGRKPLGILGWGIIGSLFVAEAVGAGYVISEFFGSNLSESNRLMISGVLGAVIAGSLFFVTERAGEEWYKNAVIKHIRTEWRHDTHRSSNIIADRSISLKRMSSMFDDEAPGWQQMVNRAYKINPQYKPTYGLIITAIVTITVIAGALLVARSSMLEREVMIQKEFNMDDQYHELDAGDFNPFDGNETSPTAFDMPFMEVESPSSIADDTPSENLSQEEQFKLGGYASYVMFTMVFMVVQLAGAWVGAKYTFVGKESQDAYRKTHRHDNAEDYAAYQEGKRIQVDQFAQKAMSNLQQRMRKTVPEMAIESDAVKAVDTNQERRFMEYVADKRAIQSYQD